MLPEGDAHEVLTFARLCPLADGDAERPSIEYEVLRDVDDADDDEPDEVSLGGVFHGSSITTWCRVLDAADLLMFRFMIHRCASVLTMYP